MRLELLCPPAALFGAPSVHDDPTPNPWPEHALNPSHISSKLERTDLPYISLKVAATLDGKIATETGESQWITGEAARAHGHGLRACHDGILVGIGTVEADDPQLTVRLQQPARNPSRIVLDSRCRIDPRARCLADDGAVRIVVTGSNAAPPAMEALRRNGVMVLQFETDHPLPGQYLPRLRACGHERLLIEGGAGVHANIVARGCPDELFLYQAGKIIGGRAAKGWCEEIGVEELAAAPRLQLSQPHMVGEDVLIHGVFEYTSH